MTRYRPILPEGYEPEQPKSPRGSLTWAIAGAFATLWAWGSAIAAGWSGEIFWALINFGFGTVWYYIMLLEFGRWRAMRRERVVKDDE